MRAMFSNRSETSAAAMDGANARRILLKALRYLWPVGQPRMQILVAAAISMVVMNKLMSVAAPYFFKLAVDGLGTPSGSTTVWLSFGVTGVVLAYGLARFTTVGFQQLRSLFFAPIGERAARLLSLEVFRQIHALDLRFHLSRQTGALSRVIDRGVGGVQSVMSIILFQTGPLLLEIAMIAVVMSVYFDVTYMVVILIVVVLYAVFTFRVTEYRVKQRARMNEEQKQTNQKSLDALLNFETVRYFAAADREAARYGTALGSYHRRVLEVNNSLILMNLGQSVIITAGLVTVLVMAVRGVQSGALTVGDFVMINAYMVQITLPLNFLGGVYRQLRQAFVDMGEMFDLLERTPEVVDASGAVPLRITGGEVAFKDVHFAYDPDRPILRGVSFRAEPGRKIAVVGPSGAGKSTIGRLLFRFYDVTAGAVLIDGQDLRTVTQDSLQRLIGVVPQDTVLFNDTLAYNIAYGCPEATRAQIEEVARAANLDRFIASLPDGYDTIVGERGLKLSGGEKQRVSIARMLLKDPPILLLDEATSALDSQTEAEVLDSLRLGGQGRTVLTIAHRLSTIVDADEIIVLEAGQVVEQGRHEDLLVRGGAYARLWQMQAAEEQA